MNACFVRCQTCNLFQKQIRVKSSAEMRVLCKFEGSRTLNFHALYRLCNLVRASDVVPPFLGPPSLPPLLFCIMQIDRRRAAPLLARSLFGTRSISESIFHSRMELARSDLPSFIRAGRRRKEEEGSRHIKINFPSQKGDL